MPKPSLSNAILLFALVMLTVFAVAVACGPVAQPGQAGRPSGERSSTPGPTPTPKPYLNLDGGLRELAQGYDAWLASGQPESTAPVRPDWEVGIYIYLTANLEAVTGFLEGKVQWQAEAEGNGPSGEDTIATAVAVSLLGQLSEQAGVSLIEKIADPMRPRPTPSPTEPTLVRSESQGPSATPDPKAPTAPPIPPSPPARKYPNMADSLHDLVDRYESGQSVTDSDEVSGQSSVEGEATVVVKVYVRSPTPRDHADAAVRFLEENGAQGGIVGTGWIRCGGYPEQCSVYGLVPVSVLGEFSRQPGVQGVSPYPSGWDSSSSSGAFSPVGCCSTVGIPAWRI